jgi:glycosyltransferase involved in cell wall biosynthesis
MVLLNNSGSGGAERRYAQVYEYLRRRKMNISLVMNESLLADLLRAGVLNEEAPSVVLKEWFGSSARCLMRMMPDSDAARGAFGVAIQKILGAAAFGLRKLDYAIGCLTLSWWILRHHPLALHLILGGAYVVLPLQWLRCAPPAAVSVVCPSLSAMVGSGLGYRLYRMALHQADVVDALTDTIRRALEEEGVSPNSIRIAPGSFVNTDRFAPSPVKYPWVVFAGRLVPEKNPDQFVAVCALVHKRCPHAKFFILGDGPLRKHVWMQVRQHGLEANLEMTWCDHMESVLAHTLVFVSMQTMDNYPSQALLEAMSCGAAVVATDVGQTGKLVDESVGMRVEAKPEAIADAVVHLLEHPEQSAVKGKSGRQRVMEQHSTDAYVDYLERLYRDLSFPSMEKA